MEVIYKQKLERKAWQGLELPKGSKILEVAIQNKEIFIWYLFNEENKADLKEFDFQIIGTGDWFNLSKDYRHIGTVHEFNKQNYVWHIFTNLPC